MPVESATYISQLVSSNPVSTDPVGQGQNHLRLLKAVLQAQFPNFTAAALTSTNAAIDSAVAGANVPGALVPTGVMLPFAGATAPSGYLKCDGSAVSRATYAALFAVISTTYGAGDGSTTFNLPDTLGRVIAAQEGASGRLNGWATGTAGGEANHALTVAELAAHNHGVTDPGHTHGVTDPTHNHTITDPGHTHTKTDPGHNHSNGFSSVQSGTAGGGASMGNGVNTGSSTTGISYASATTGLSHSAASTGISINSTTTGITTNNNGSGTAHNNVQPTLVVGMHIIKT